MSDLAGEVWKPAGGYEGAYEVSNCGRVRSLPRVTTRKNGMPLTVAGRVRKIQTFPTGYRYVTLRDRTVYIHRLVAAAFIPNPEDKPEVNHRDGDKANNRVSNLEWATRRENVAHAFATGIVQQNGSDNPMSKLQEVDVEDILRRLAGGAKQRDLAAAFGVTKDAISSIALRKKWAHVRVDGETENLIRKRFRPNGPRLTPDQIAEMRSLRASGQQIIAIVNKFDVHPATAAKYVKG